ncbi:MAG TPA: tRNA (adenosine(37)-N6)-threonylcarbamoyltransferase complex transferase subunit TsaD [Candidatus Saccharimonadales bacterium]|nr:tRNA (adenosine(37)-N6)-threonylcarbamoyltransferase complex transferase subunit TsaD [Candidatus Saccharimonadales bacterium]
MKILGIETSCDETAAAVVEDGYKLLSNVVASSADLHVQYGGVVPEIAARSHIEVILPVIKEALEEADCTRDDIDAIAVTYGAGLGGSLLIGVMTARTLAATLGKPLYAINHVEAHIYANFLTEECHPERNASEVEGPRVTANGISRQARDDKAQYVFPAKQPEFPMLAILVSGGHSQLVLFKDHFDYQLLGQTHDDAIGEAFDKVAKILGLPYPGGPSVAELAEKGDPNRYKFPKAKMTGVNPSLEAFREQFPAYGLRPTSYDFSFSGLKTAVLRQAQAAIGEDYSFPSFKLSERLSEAQKADIAASFQRTAVETIVDKAKLAVEEFAPKSIVIAGGTAANQELRDQLSAALSEPRTQNLELFYPDLKLCTDNAAMVATLACFKMKLDQPAADPYSLEIAPNLSM